jgi:hypothetical protein
MFSVHRNNYKMFLLADIFLCIVMVVISGGFLVSDLFKALCYEES